MGVVVLRGNIRSSRRFVPKPGIHLITDEEVTRNDLLQRSNWREVGGTWMNVRGVTVRLFGREVNRPSIFFLSQRTAGVITNQRGQRLLVGGKRK